jgi:hypothetical protein
LILEVNEMEYKLGNKVEAVYKRRVVVGKIIGIYKNLLGKKKDLYCLEIEGMEEGHDGFEGIKNYSEARENTGERERLTGNYDEYDIWKKNRLNFSYRQILGLAKDQKELDFGA